MPLETALASYAGLTCWALSTNRLRRDLNLRGPAKGIMRAIGAMLWAFAAWLAVLRFGPYQAAVALVGMLSLSGLVLVLLISQWPRLAAILGGVSLAGAILSTTMISG